MSRLGDYYSALDGIAPGWNKSKHQQAVSDAQACAASNKSGGPIERMKNQITCMKGKKQYAK
ncbi:MAG: hypothetical protein WCY09_09780 [Candidatus Omnitrophota bacterium]|jgi:hypothetical protein